MQDKVVIRYKDGKVLKGFAHAFDDSSDHINVKMLDSDEQNNIPFEELKAVFFVRSFEGTSSYREKKRYGISEKKGDRVFVKFSDGELLVGYLIGDVPWDKKKGFNLSKSETKQKGFYMLPSDLKSNNIKVFVPLSYVQDVFVMY